MINKYFLVALLCLSLNACSGAGLTKLALGSITGGGIGEIIPDNAQIGKTNTQTIGFSETTDLTVKNVTGSQVKPIIRPEGIVTNSEVDSISQVNNNIPAWLVIALVIWSIFLWQLPSPTVIFKSVGNVWRKLFKNKDVDRGR